MCLTCHEQKRVLNKRISCIQYVVPLAMGAIEVGFATWTRFGESIEKISKDFTSISEELKQDDLILLLTVYLSVMTRIIEFGAPSQMAFMEVSKGTTRTDSNGLENQILRTGCRFCAFSLLQVAGWVAVNSFEVL